MKLHVQRTSLALTGSLVLLIGFAGLVTPSAYAATAECSLRWRHH